MVKKSGAGSTGKKKSTAKKKAVPKKSVPVSGAAKKDVKGPKKPIPKAAATPKAKAKPKKVATPKKPKVTIKELLFRKFDTGVMEALAAKSAYKPKGPKEIPDAPPFVTGYDAKETERIRALLFKAFDLKGEAPVEETAEVSAVEKAPEPISEAVEKPELPAPPPSVSAGGPHTVARSMVLGLCGLALLIAIVIWASFSNRDKFYLKDADGAVQVWRGKFAPAGAELVISLDGMKIPDQIRDVYSEKEAFSLVYNYFQDKADAALNEPEVPDFRTVNRYLRQAASYAPTLESRARVQRRLNGISFLVFLHRTDVALARRTLPDLQAAQTYLDKASSYASIDYQHELVERRRVAVEKTLASLVAQ